MKLAFCLVMAEIGELLLGEEPSHLQVEVLEGIGWLVSVRCTCRRLTMIWWCLLLSLLRLSVRIILRGLHCCALLVTLLWFVQCRLYPRSGIKPLHRFLAESACELPIVLLLIIRFVSIYQFEVQGALVSFESRQTCLACTLIKFWLV